MHLLFPILLTGLLVAQACGHSTQRPNILLVSIDALRADHVGAYGYRRQTTPFLDQLASKGTRFTNAFVPLPATDPSHASLFTSLHPLQHGVLANAVVLPDHVETLAEVLHSNGYFTIGAVAVTHMKRRYGFQKGFDVFSDEWNEDEFWNSPHYRVAPSVNDSVLSMIDSYVRQKPEKPFFAFVHYFDVHSPYNKHDQFGIAEPVPSNPRIPTHGESRDLVERYDSEIRFVDEHIRQLYMHLQRAGLTDNLLIVVLADHGEQLGEHGYSGGHADIYRETIRIPLIFSGTGIENGIHEEHVSSMDVSSSLLSLLGLSFSKPVLGRDVLHEDKYPWTRWTKRQSPRQLLVLGYPQYTRSAAIIEGDRWYIRNLDYAYKFMFTEQIEDSQTELDSEKLVEARTIHDGNYLVRLPSPVTRLVPVYVAAEIYPKLEPCRAQVKVHLEPGLTYRSQPFDVERPVRVHYPASLTDTTSLSISPPDCVDKVVYKLNEFAEISHYKQRLNRTHNTEVTDLWQNLLTSRKAARGDELYDLSNDPDMLVNLAGLAEYEEEVRDLRAKINQQWATYSRSAEGSRAVGVEYTEEEIELLRSLGYVR